MRKPPVRTPAHSPRRGGGSVLQIPRLKCHTAISQHSLIFFTKYPGTVMFILMLDVISHGFQLRSAYRKRTITFLPCKIGLPHFLMNPSGGNRFEFPHHMGQLMGGAQSDQQMHMVSHPANNAGHPAQCPNNTSEIGMQSLTSWLSNKRVMSLGSENQVVMQAKVGRWHNQCSNVPPPLAGRNAIISITGGLRHRLISEAPPGLENPSSNVERFCRMGVSYDPQDVTIVF